MQTLPAFLNACRILHSIDMHEMVAAGAISGDDFGGWRSFAAAPVDWLLRQDDDTVDAVWRIVQRRQPERYRESAVAAVRAEAR